MKSVVSCRGKSARWNCKKRKDWQTSSQQQLSRNQQTSAPDKRLYLSFLTAKTWRIYEKKRLDEKTNEKLKDFVLLSLHFCDLIYNGYKKNRERKVG
jgi:hypothetical protein